MHGELKTFLRSVRNSYSALVFSRDSWVGIALLLVTFLYPMSGLCGLLCCLLVNAPQSPAVSSLVSRMQNPSSPSS